MTTATVIVPTHVHATTLPVAVESVLLQTVPDIEVIIIGDGTDDETRGAAASMARRDERVTFVDREKGLRHGEAYRHEALASTRGEVVCYLSDDDLWLPDHVETMVTMLRNADFVHALPIMVEADGTMVTLGVDLSEPFWREWLLRVENRVPLSCMAHTRAAYDQLPFGWRPAPPDVFTDLHMIRQFLGQPGLRFGSSPKATVVHFPSPWRQHLSGADRCAELETWARNLSSPEGRADFRTRTYEQRSFERNGWESYGLQLQDRVAILERHAAYLEHVVAERTDEIEHLRTVERDLADAHMCLQQTHEVAVERYEIIETQRARLGELAARVIESDSRLAAIVVDEESARRELADVCATLTWRVRRGVLRAPLVGRALRTIGARRAARSSPGASPSKRRSRR